MGHCIIKAVFPLLLEIINESGQVRRQINAGAVYIKITDMLSFLLIELYAQVDDKSQWYAGN